MRTALVLAFLSVSVSFPAFSQSAGNECPASINDSSSGGFGNDALRTTLWPGPVVFKPGGPGFVDSDGGLGMKWPFVRLIEGQLAVGGRRLDGEAPPARAYLNDGYGSKGFQPVYLVFPTPGCWEITAGVAGRSMTFIVLVEKIADGPDWKFDGVPAGWYATTSWDQFSSRN